MKNLERVIGNTPLVQVKSLQPSADVKIFAKLEGQNPGGSVKDRAAYGMIKTALEDGTLKTGDHLVEATSGNTGIALAMIAAVSDLRISLIMPESASAERVQTMKAYGAEVILTPEAGTIEYSREYALQLAEEKGYHILNQFGNPANPQRHYLTTGPEIWKDTEHKITHFVSSMGTTGTIMGVSRYLKEQNPEVQIIGTQPQEGSRIPGIRRWSPEFLPKIYEPHRVDRIIDVSRDEAVNHTRKLSKQEGLFVGISSGGAMAAALKLAAELEEATIVTIACDRGDRYLSNNLYQ
ncbi:MAG: cysteine synthase CysM [Flavobacteriales bacterium]